MQARRGVCLATAKAVSCDRGTGTAARNVALGAVSFRAGIERGRNSSISPGCGKTSMAVRPLLSSFSLRLLLGLDLRRCCSVWVGTSIMSAKSAFAMVTD